MARRKLTKRELQTRARAREKRAQARREAVLKSGGYFRIPDLALRYGVTRETLWSWRKGGALPDPEKLGPNSVGWPVEVILEFERNRSGSAA